MRAEAKSHEEQKRRFFLKYVKFEVKVCRIKKIKRLPARILLASIFCVLFLQHRALAGPQHWGSGYPYLVTLQDINGQKQLVVYEPPIRAKDTVWISRWIDRSANYTDVIPGGICVGNFWPKQIGEEYLLFIEKNDPSFSIKVLKAPEYFTASAWEVIYSGPLTLPGGDILSVTAGALPQPDQDRLLILMHSDAMMKMVIINPPSEPSQGGWNVATTITLPLLAGEVRGFAVGDFWGENKDHIAITTSANGKTKIYFFEFNEDRINLITQDEAEDLPPLAKNGLIAADFVKDGFDVLALFAEQPEIGFQLRVAPFKLPTDKPNPGPIYTGKTLSGQWLPGAGQTKSKLVMTGRFQSYFGNSAIPFALTAGRIFGYIRNDYRFDIRYPLDTSPDAEISFMHRTPLKNERYYGWPEKNESVTYEINLKNNGQTVIPAGSARLRVWINTPFRNADTHPETCDNPDMTIPVKVDLPPFDLDYPNYIKFQVTSSWPYDLIPAGPQATWKKLNVDEVGERWLVVSLDCVGDSNMRNNRYEAAFHGLTYHPIFRYNSTLADRKPTVEGDPCSLEYLSRKMADAITCTWERSRTTNNEDVLQRVFFDGYEIGFPDDLPEPERSERWRWIQERYEGWRELDLWWGHNQTWEDFSWRGSPELHESGHLFHPLGDLYGNYVMPVWSGLAKMADGTPVQLRTNLWGPDLFGSGEAIIGPPACEMMKKCLIGVRKKQTANWWYLAPDRVFVRVLDRYNKPVSDEAQVSLWRYGYSEPDATGTTSADGRWEFTYLFGQAEVDEMGRKFYPPYNNNQFVDANAHIFTLQIGSYQDAAVLGMKDINSHSRLTYMYHSFIDEQEWTWDFHTNYDHLASEPNFALSAAVEGSMVELGIYGMPGATYRLYRRWEPAYLRVYLGEFRSEDYILKISQDMAEPDSRTGGRFRAIYEVTEVMGDRESLPRVVALVGLSNARGVTKQSDGKLLVASNSGIANPFCILFNGTTPYQEYFFHFRFGHTATKIVPSRLFEGRYYATLAGADTPWWPDYRFDLIVPSKDGWKGYDVRNDIGGFHATSYTISPPFQITLASAEEALRIKPNDMIFREDSNSANVLASEGNTLIVDRLIFSAQPGTPGDYDFWGRRFAGRPGNRAEFRELQGARGLAVILQGGKEFLVIADTENHRIVIWDDKTGYVTHWQQDAAEPATIAEHPVEHNKFFVIDRQRDRQSKLYLFSFNGALLSVEPGYPVPIDTGEYVGPYPWLISEMGLAAAVEPETGNVLLAITDGQYGRVIELKQVGQSWQVINTYNQAMGLFVGSSQLFHPFDVAYTSTESKLKLFALDNTHPSNNTQRLLLLKEATSPNRPPDLIVTEIKFYKPRTEEKTIPQAGELVTCKAILTNQGKASTGIFNVKWFLDERQVGYGSHANLEPNQTSNDNVRFDWIPTSGTHTLEFVADCDNHVNESNETDNSFSKTITVNSPPVLEPIGNKVVNEAETLTFIVSAQDPDGDTLTYSASNLPLSSLGSLPQGASFDSMTRKFSWRPTYEQAGVYNIRFEVKDTSGDSDSEDVQITVIDVNRNPVIKARCFPIYRWWTRLWFFTSQGTYDPDKDKLTYLWEFGDGKTSKSPNTIHIYKKPGIYTATLTVTDSKNASSKATFSIIVRKTSYRWPFYFR